ncbi:MAG: glutaminase [Bacteroides sp.]|nr:glutaminase [Bacteroides sp.]
MDYQSIIERIYQEVKPFTAEGKVADYIPALAGVSRENLGISVHDIEGKEYGTGQVNVPFSIQSISKVFSFTLAYHAIGEKVWNRLGKEPSGTAFNSLVQIEYEHGIPRNPFINAGALVVADIILSNYKYPWRQYLDFVRKISNDTTIGYNEQVAVSEKETGHRNAALAHFMHSYGNIVNPVEEVLDFYFKQCALEMCTRSLSRSFLYLANQGVLPHSGEEILAFSQSKRMNALMLMAGLYNESGEFAYRVGLPGKSGVGGGIVAIFPKHFSLCVWSPAINQYGNSIAGIEALQRFTSYTQMSVF